MWSVGMKTPSKYDGYDVEKTGLLLGLYLKQRMGFSKGLDNIPLRS